MLARRSAGNAKSGTNIDSGVEHGLGGRAPREGARHGTAFMLSQRMDLSRGSGCTPYGDPLMPLSRSRLAQHLRQAEALLRGRQDAGNVSDLLLALLFLKRCSDRFKRRRDEVIGLVGDTGRSQADAEASAENPRWYRNDVGIWLPPASRFQSLLDETTGLAPALNRALAGVEVGGRSLAAVAAHIDFTRQIGRSRLTDSRLRKVLQLFSPLQLDNEALAWPGLLSVVIDDLFHDGDMPASIATLMARLSGAGHIPSVFDPACGHGTLLCAVADQAARQNAAVPQLAGEEGDGHRWAVATLRLLLRGVRNGQLEYLHGQGEHAAQAGLPVQRHGAVLSRPRGTGVAELDSLRQMLGRAAEGGCVVTVVSREFLVGAGEAQDLRAALLDADRVDAVITGLPLRGGCDESACVLVLRQQRQVDGQWRSGRASERQGRVPLLDAAATRASGADLAQCCERVIACFESMVDIPGFSRVVDVASIAAEAYRLDVAEWLADAQAEVPEDLKAHVLGGVPRTVLTPLNALSAAFGMDWRDFFVDRDKDYLDFRQDILTREDLAGRLDALPAVVARRSAVQAAVSGWWETLQALLIDSADQLDAQADIATTLACCAATLRGSAERLVAALAPIGVLSSSGVRALSAGIDALWHEDLLTLSRHGFAGVIDGWRDGILVDLDAGRPLDHPLLRRYLAAETAAFNESVPTVGSVPEAAHKGKVFSLRRFRSCQRRLQEAVESLLCELSPASAQALVLAVFQDQLLARIDAALDELQRRLVSGLERCWDQYRYSLVELEARREVAIATLQATLRVAGHV